MSKVTFAEHIANYLCKREINEIFAISGASNLRILDAIHTHPEVEYRCVHHEQAGVMAGMARTRLTGKPSVMLVTAGPGASNTVTGLASAHLDSVPVIVIAGQEKSELLEKHKKLRGKGVQGLDMMSIVKSVTKHQVYLDDASTAVEEFNRAFEIAVSGRPGPVWIEVPQDIQPMLVDEAKASTSHKGSQRTKLEEEADAILSLLKASKRPIFWVGQGVRIAGAQLKLLELLERLKVPVLSAWNGLDIVCADHPLFAGRAGVYGNRSGNFALQNCDLLVTLGSRLAIPQIGYVHSEFAREAKKVLVDIDQDELEKFDFPIEKAICADVGDLIETLLRKCNEEKLAWESQEWLTQCNTWKKRFPPVGPEHREKVQGKVNSYVFIEELSKQLPNDAVIVTDMGSSLTCTHAAISLKQGQRLITSTGLGEMGFGLPGAIGACFGNGKRPVVFIGAEGSLQMNLQEFQTIVHHKLPIQCFIMNNDSYLTIKHTERALFGDRLSGSSPETGVSFPSLEKLMSAYGIKYTSISDESSLADTIAKVLESREAILCDVFMPENQFLGPKTAVKVGADGNLFSPPLEDLSPFLSREELRENMIIDMVEEKS